MMSPPCEMVFVYGTLRRGGSNHFRMEGAEFVTAATVRGRLYRIDWYPGLVLDASGDEISGEIYQISCVMLDLLDQYEGNEYRRVRVMVTLPDAAPHAAWVWEWPGHCDENQRILSGDWLSPPR